MSASVRASGVVFAVIALAGVGCTSKAAVGTSREITIADCNAPTESIPTEVVYFTARVTSPAKYEDNGFHCTGALIGPRVILTAGHCVTEWIETAKKEPTLTYSIDIQHLNTAEPRKKEDAVVSDLVVSTTMYKKYDKLPGPDLGIIVLSQAPFALAAYPTVGYVEGDLSYSAMDDARKNFLLSKPVIHKHGKEYTYRGEGMDEPASMSIYAVSDGFCAPDGTARKVVTKGGDSGAPVFAPFRSGKPNKIAAVLRGTAGLKGDDATATRIISTRITTGEGSFSSWMKKSIKAGGVPEADFAQYPVMQIADD